MPEKTYLDLEAENTRLRLALQKLMFAEDELEHYFRHASGDPNPFDVARELLKK